jgi:uncharacterized repeat protein (TIGR01451 family)
MQGFTKEGVAAWSSQTRDTRLPGAIPVGSIPTPSAQKGRQRVLLGGFGLTIAALLLMAFAATALAAPAWRIDSLSNTTAPPGGTLNYHVQAFNVGDAATDGSDITLTATLPSGLTFASETDAGGTWSCTGSTVVTCTDSADVVPPLADQYRGLVLSVAVDPGVSGVVTSTFEVSGGDVSDPSASTVDPTQITDALPGFGVDAFDGQTTADGAGDPFTQAGGHPYALTTEIDFNTLTNANPLIGDVWPPEPTKDVFVDLPPGLVGNPTAAATCSAAELANSSGTDARPLCSPASQIGTVLLRANGLGVLGPFPVFNLVPPPDAPARIGFNALGTLVALDAKLRSGSDYGLSVKARDVPEGLALLGTSLTVWGVPADPSHDSERACPGQSAPSLGGPTCATNTPRAAFWRIPTACPEPGQGLQTTAQIDSWAHPGSLTTDGLPRHDDPFWQVASFVSHAPPNYPASPSARGPPLGPNGCEKVPFDPSLTAEPVSPAVAGAPSGFTFRLTLPQNPDPDAIDEADLKKAVVSLPQGVRVSPSSADGLGGCPPEQFAVHADMDPTCPDSSKIGTVTIHTPLLNEPLSGSIYLASPGDNPFGSLLAIYLVAKGPGVIVKLAGKIDADPNSGQLTTTFDDNPQLPFDDLELEFKGGPRAPLALPDACGTFTTHAVLSSWSGKTVSSDSSFTVDHGPDGGACVPFGFAPNFSAGSRNPVAGKYTPFLLSLSRGDSDEQLQALTVDMPTGLTGRIANTVLCPELAARTGACGDGSKIGNVTVGAGAGSSPFWITNGRAYITGPYKGAPFGLAIVVPAVAGPFDLGNVVVRAAIFVDRQSARLKVASDPFPTILQGIPLDLRAVRVTIDRDRFIVNPTSCAVKHVAATIGSAVGAIAHRSARFQVGECANLPLAPKLTLIVGAKHHTKAGVSTPLTTVLQQTPGQTNLRSVSVLLPTTLNALLPVLNRACTLAQYESGRCSRSARAGSAVAVTPLLRDPLRGSVFFVKNPKRVLPDLIVALRGQVAVDVIGKVGVNPRTNQLTTKFDTIPDVPITKFALRLVAGANGPLGATVNLCTANSRRAMASIGFRGQNGKVLQVKQRLRVLGCAKALKSS